MSATQPQGKAPYQKPQMEIITLSQSEEFFTASPCVEDNSSYPGSGEVDQSPRIFGGGNVNMALSRESRGWERW